MTTTRRHDGTHGSRARVLATWVVDPDTPSLIAWEMRDGAYAQVAKVSGDESAVLTAPFEVTVVAADLIL